MSSLEKILAIKHLTVTQLKEGEQFFDYIYSDELLGRHILIEYDAGYEGEEFITLLSVFFYTEEFSGRYRLYADTDEDESVLKAYRPICDLVEFIENTTDEALMDNLSSIAISGFGSDAYKN